MKGTPAILFILLGIIVIWTGATGTIGTLFASIFSPQNVSLQPPSTFGYASTGSGGTSSSVGGGGGSGGGSAGGF